MGLPKDTLTSVDCEIDGVTDIIHEAISSRRDRESPEPEGTGHLPVTCESLGIDPLNPNADALVSSQYTYIGSASFLGPGFFFSFRNFNLKI